jgi:hypothetical protein
MHIGSDPRATPGTVIAPVAVIGPVSTEDVKCTILFCTAVIPLPNKIVPEKAPTVLPYPSTIFPTAGAELVV